MCCIDRLVPVCEPVLRFGECGWLATTPADHPYRIGVIAETEPEARRKFSYALSRWEELARRRAGVSTTGTDA